MMRSHGKRLLRGAAAPGGLGWGAVRQLNAIYDTTRMFAGCVRERRMCYQVRLQEVPLSHQQRNLEGALLATPSRPTEATFMLKQRDSIANGSGAAGLNGSTELRLRNQLERALQHCFGAEEGLRVLVTLATTQM